MTGLLKVFSIDVYALLDLGTTLSFVTTFVAKKFDVLPDMLHEPLVISNPVGEPVVEKRVYKNCPITLTYRVSYGTLTCLF